MKYKLTLPLYRFRYSLPLPLFFTRVYVVDGKRKPLRHRRKNETSRHKNSHRRNDNKKKKKKERGLDVVKSTLIRGPCNLMYGRWKGATVLIMPQVSIVPEPTPAAGSLRRSETPYTWRKVGVQTFEAMEHTRRQRCCKPCSSGNPHAREIRTKKKDEKERNETTQRTVLETCESKN